MITLTMIYRNECDIVDDKVAHCDKSGEHKTPNATARMAQQQERPKHLCEIEAHHALFSIGGGMHDVVLKAAHTLENPRVNVELVAELWEWL